MILSLPATAKHFRYRTPFVLGVMTFGIILLIIDSIRQRGFVSAMWWGYGLSAVFVVFSLATRDKMMLRFILFALSAGFAELVADAWLVDYTNTLIYPLPEPIIWASPAYMPFSWTVVLVEVGYIGWLVTQRWGLVKASFFLCLLGALLVPMYESWAIHAGWWHYQHTEMIFKVPVYVIIAEGLLMLTMPFMLGKVQNAPVRTVILWGLAEGFVMLIACFIAYGIAG
jgi:hypothetical protein